MLVSFASKTDKNKQLQLVLGFLIILVFCARNVAVVHASGLYSPYYKITTMTQNSVESNIVGLLPESPRCWKSAVALFYQTQLTPEEGEQLIVKLCQIMPEEKLKLLALEIARCHLEDLGKPLIDDPLLLKQCSFQAGDGMQDVHYCLKHLTDAGANAYTHYVSYVQQLCTRLTQEMIMNIQNAATNEMAKRHAEISLQSIELAERQAEQMAMLANMPEQVKERLTEELTESLKLSLAQSLDHQLNTQLPAQLNEHLDNQLRSLLSSHAAEQTQVAEKILKQAEERSTEQKERLEQLYQGQREALNAQLQEQREKVKALSDTVSKTSQTIQPLLGIQTLVVAATQGYTWLTFLLHFLGTFNIIWLITRPQRCHNFRGYLFGVIITEALFEIGVMMLSQHELLTETERVSAVTEVRRWTLSLECLIYVFGLLFSRAHQPDYQNVSSDENDELHQYHNTAAPGRGGRQEPPHMARSYDQKAYFEQTDARPRGIQQVGASARQAFANSSPQLIWPFSHRDNHKDEPVHHKAIPNFAIHGSMAAAVTDTEHLLACRTQSLAVGSIHDLSPHGNRHGKSVSSPSPSAKTPSPDLIPSTEQADSFDEYFDAEEYNENYKRPRSAAATCAYQDARCSKKARRHVAQIDKEADEDDKKMTED